MERTKELHQARVIVTTCDPYLWVLHPFAYLFNTYWSEQQPVLVAGYTPNSKPLPSNFTFHAIDRYNYPAAQWSDGIIRLLHHIDDDYFIWMLEDMWLTRTVDHQAINSLIEYARMRNDILRIDLTTDRLYSHDPRYTPDFDKWGRLNIIKSEVDWPYHISTQCAIWNRSKLLHIIKPGMTPWQFELQSGPIAAQYPSWLVLGTRQIPVQYKLTIRQKPIPEELDLNGIPNEHVDEMKRRGYFSV